MVAVAAGWANDCVPLLLGAVQLTVALPLPGVAVTSVGELGGVGASGVTDEDAVDVTVPPL
jgi:hypothetical protein